MGLFGLALVHASVEPEEIAKRWSPSILFIAVQNEEGGGVGSGFFIDEKHAVTSWHVVSGAKSIKVATKEKHEANARTVASLPGYDLALIEVDQGLGNGAAMVIRKEPARDLEKVYVCGNPEATSFVWSDGSVGNALQKTEMGDLIQITAPISPGSSGGPVLDSDGKVIGIIKCYLKSGQNLNFAVPVKYLENLFVEKDRGDHYSAILSLPEWRKFKSAAQDGDQDLIVNNIDSEASIFKNNTRETLQRSYLKIRFRGPAANRNGIGAKATIWSKGHAQVVENFPIRGYLSSMESGVFVGLDKS
jgi:S1-C subfamily serine protease